MQRPFTRGSSLGASSVRSISASHRMTWPLDKKRLFTAADGAAGMRGDGEPHVISEIVSWDFALPYIEDGLPAPFP